MGNVKSNGLEWTNIRVTLGQLKPWADNPRMSSKAQAKRILQSVERWGQPKPVEIGPDGELYDGHQRLSALLTVYGANYEVDARRASRALTEDERRRYVLDMHWGAQGSANWDALSNWSDTLLRDAGIDEELLRSLNADAAAVAEMLRAASEEGAEQADGDDTPRPTLSDRFCKG